MVPEAVFKIGSAKFNDEWSNAIFPDTAPDAHRDAARWAMSILMFHGAILIGFAGGVFRILSAPFVQRPRVGKEPGSAELSSAQKHSD